MFLYLQDMFCCVLVQVNKFKSRTVAMCYKSEGRWFDPRWCNWNFSLT